MRTLLLSYLLVLTPIGVNGQAPSSFDTTNLSKYIESTSKIGQLPDVAVAVVGERGFLYQTEIRTNSVFGGLKSKGAINAQISNQSFHIGSISEILTAFAVMQLVDDGIIDMDTPVSQYLSALDLSDQSRTKLLTIRNLLTHRSGLSSISFFSRRVQLERSFKYIDFIHDPGTKTEVSGLNYMILRMVLESVSNKSYQQYMLERVFEPLGIKNPYTYDESLLGRDVATGHNYLFGWPIANKELTPEKIRASDVHLALSASELGRFLSLLLNEDITSKNRLLSSLETETLPWHDRASFANQIISHEKDHTWNSVPGSRNKAWYKEGVSLGFHALLGIIPDKKIGIIVLANRTGGLGSSAANVVLYGTVNRIIGGTQGKLFPWERILHIALLIFVITEAIKPVRWYQRWRKIGSPRATAHTLPIVGRLILDLMITVTIPLVVILGIAKMSIAKLIELYPDIGLALIIFPIATIPTAVWRALVKSEILRQHQN